ncbi:ATP phosphoribosyltransferase regulatory subunit, divergent variant [hydrothermal vent metagenome]|uniref:ATP phosphoribosyltransferase regulatory subunit, divergent variant n=1 Tax=hydrothermal vent metagenome TaxID=652676 RepID=A0A3B1DSM8_9ZZZZ
MIFEHEIPKGSRLYFGKTAKQKRFLEAKVSAFFSKIGFEEVVTPNFSYSQHQSIDNTKDLITVTDEANNDVALRADSTLDVVRIITKRLGRTTTHKKWFYIQPVFIYPSTETYQIGCEWIEHNDVSDLINLNADILTLLKIRPTIQIANINIPKLICDYLNISIENFKNGEVGELFELNIDWLNKLIAVKSVQELKNIINIVPSSIKNELEKLLNIASSIKYSNVIVSPLYYDAMKYYDDVYYIVIKDNLIIASGGGYQSDGIISLGFALYTDNLLEILKDQKGL